MRIGGIEFDITEEEYEEFKDLLLTPDYNYQKEIVKSLRKDVVNVITKGEPKKNNKHKSGKRGDIPTYLSHFIDKLHRFNRSSQLKYSVYEIFTFFYSLGFNQKEIVFLFHKLGMPVYEFTIHNFLLNNRLDLKKERDKMLALTIETKTKVFQAFQDEVYEVEGKTIQIYLRSIKKLQEALDKIDPETENTKFMRVMNQIETLQNKVKDAHGVNQMREAQVSANKEIFIAREKHKIEHGEPEQKEKLINPTQNFLEFHDVETSLEDH